MLSAIYCCKSDSLGLLEDSKEDIYESDCSKFRYNERHLYKELPFAVSGFYHHLHQRLAFPSMHKRQDARFAKHIHFPLHLIFLHFSLKAELIMIYSYHIRIQMSRCFVEPCSQQEIHQMPYGIFCHIADYLIQTNHLLNIKVSIIFPPRCFNETISVEGTAQNVPCVACPSALETIPITKILS